eukprot:g26896.t1
MNDELETCCVCLDALSSAPSSILVSSSHRVCHHFIHTLCAEKLSPRKCPLCRQCFAHVSVPLDQRWLSSTAPEERESTFAKGQSVSL